MRPTMPRPGDVRGALPGLLIMALIAAAGVLFAFGVREALPRDLFVTAPFSGLSAEDVEIDPATGLPIVPPPSGSEVVTWSAAQPNARIEPADRWASTKPAGAAEAGRSSVTLLATYPSYQEARAVAQELAVAVGDPSAEAAWLEAAGVDPGDGFGWAGPEATDTPFVQVVDRWLLVDDLEWREDHEPPIEEGTDTAGAYRAPLAEALAASASSVLVEGDRGGEGAIAFDLVCFGDAAELRTLEQDLADLDDRLLMRPPWAAPPLTLEEQRARRTQRLVTQMQAASFLQDVLRSAEMQRLVRELDRASEAGDESAARAATSAIRFHLAALAPGSLPELGPLADVLEARALGWALGDLSVPMASPSPEELAARSAAFGAAQPGRLQDGSATYEVRADGRRLWVTLGRWQGVAQGLGPFVEYLDANGCDDIQVVFHDYDEVRGD